MRGTKTDRVMSWKREINEDKKYTMVKYGEARVKGKEGFGSELGAGV